MNIQIVTVTAFVITIILNLILVINVLPKKKKKCPPKILNRPTALKTFILLEMIVSCIWKNTEDEK